MATWLFGADVGIHTLETRLDRDVAADLLMLDQAVKCPRYSYPYIHSSAYKAMSTCSIMIKRESNLLHPILRVAFRTRKMYTVIVSLLNTGSNSFLQVLA